MPTRAPNRRSTLIGVCILLTPAAGVLQAKAPGYGLIAIALLIIALALLVGSPSTDDPSNRPRS